MKKFKFKYESILKMRSDRLDSIRDRMRILNTERNQLEAMKAMIMENRKGFMEQTKKNLEKGSKSHEFQRINVDMQYFRSQIEDVELKISELEDRITKLHEELLIASQELKMMEKLREKDEVEYFRELEVMDLKVIEEIVNYRNFKDKG